MFESLAILSLMNGSQFINRTDPLGNFSARKNVCSTLILLVITMARKARTSHLSEMCLLTKRTTQIATIFLARKLHNTAGRPSLRTFVDIVDSEYSSIDNCSILREDIDAVEPSQV